MRNEQQKIETLSGWNTLEIKQKQSAKTTEMKYILLVSPTLKMSAKKMVYKRMGLDHQIKQQQYGKNSGILNCIGI